MVSLKERISNWRNNRSPWQKSADILFWVLLILLIIPGTRKIISTGVNKAVLLVKSPGMVAEEKQETLTELDYNWILGTADGDPIFLSENRDRVLFLNFWATWCPPCVAELPEIQRAYDKYGHEVIFFLVANQQPEVVEPFLEERGYDLPVYYIGTPVPEIFRSDRIPTTYIISREGKIVSEKTGAVNWDSKATYKLFEELLR
jgi:thiol-disulfide isomerase/thioredoxin